MHKWDKHTLPPFTPGILPARQVDELLHQQRSSWELFRNGDAALARIVTRRFTIDGMEVIVQANPGRSVSTNARVDAKSVADRPCFLCPASLPPEERGIAFGRYVILPNPYPVLPRHLTIAFHQHEPQRIENSIGDFCAVTKALGPELFVLYNGPRCGASAPDHLHFQACDADGVPLFSQLPDTTGTDAITSLKLGGRNLLTGNFSSTTQAAGFLTSAIDNLQRCIGSDDEPMVNIVARFVNNRFSITLFPRSKHRSACFFAPPEERLSISPAAVEMAGIVVVADLAHFERVSAEAVAAIYREVTLDDDRFSRFTEAMQ